MAAEQDQPGRHTAELADPRTFPDLSGIYIKRPVEGFVFPNAHQLVTEAQRELRDKYNLGKGREVPTPPVKLFETLEGFAQRGIRRFDEVYYQPGMQLEKNDKFWDKANWARPGGFLWQLVRAGSYPKESTVLPEGWFIGDRRGKPMLVNLHPKYGDDDYMEAIMEALREAGVIAKPGNVPDYSRAGASAREIEEIILPAFAEASGAKGIVRYKTYLEFNIRGNIAHPEWGRTDSYESFADQGTARLGSMLYASRLIGGDLRTGGLAHVQVSSFNGRSCAVGFSPVVEFPSKLR